MVYDNGAYPQPLLSVNITSRVILPWKHPQNVKGQAAVLKMQTRIENVRNSGRSRSSVRMAIHNLRWRHGLALTGITLIALVGCGGSIEPTLQPAEWNFGTIAATTPVEQELSVANPGRRPMEVRFISTCTCLTIEPEQVELAKGGSATVSLHYDPSEDQGEIAMQVIVHSGRGRAVKRRALRVAGRVLPGESAVPIAVEPKPRASAKSPQLSFEYYYDPGCKGCELLLVRQMISLQQELGIRLRVSQYDIGNMESQQRYLRKLEELGAEEKAYPAVIFADFVLQGEEEIQRKFKTLLQNHLDSLHGSNNP